MTLFRAMLWMTCVAAPLAASSAAAQEASSLPISTRIDFQDAELRVVITAIAEAGGLNVQYGEIPNKRMTLRLPQGMTRADMLPLLKSVATSNGMRVVTDGNLYRLETVDANAAANAAAGRREAPQLYVYRLKHARATRLATTLQALYGGKLVDPNTSGLAQRGLSQQLRGTLIAPVNPDTMGRAPGVQGTTVLPGATSGDIQIVPDETTNSLLIRAQPSDYETIRLAVDALDLRPLQVFIEVLIAEVRRTRALDLGVNANATSAKNGNETTGSLTSNTTDNFLVRISRGGSVAVDVALSALAEQGDVHILSRPLILAENNLEARILVGSQRPFVQVFRSLPTDGAVRDQVVQYRDVGTSLSIIPTINPDGYVNLEVRQEVSSATTELAFGAPVISTREATTHLFVKDAQTVVIGGLADRAREQSRSGIPFLSSIPGIGVLFGATHASDAQNELYLFLTPHIVASDEDAARLRQGVEGRLDAVGGRPLDNPSVTRAIAPTPPSARPNP